MSLSLDIVGKMAILTISILVAAGIIAQIPNWINGETIFNGNEEVDEDKRVMLEENTVDDEEGIARRVANHVEMCEEMTRGMHEDHTCFIVSWEADETLSEGALEDEISDDIDYEIHESEFEIHQLVIGFNLAQERIEIEE